jgi:hypothetical protein
MSNSNLRQIGKFFLLRECIFSSSSIYKYKKYSRSIKLICVDIRWFFKKKYLIITKPKESARLRRHTHSGLCEPKIKLCWTTISSHRCSMRLARYNFKVTHRAGKYNRADYLSRNQSTRRTASLVNKSKYTNLIAAISTNTAISEAEIVEATKADEILKIVSAMIQSGNISKDQRVKPYVKLLIELTITSSSLILRGNRIIIPTYLKRKVFALAHTCVNSLHLVREKSKALVWLILLILHESISKRESVVSFSW